MASTKDAFAIARLNYASCNQDAKGVIKGVVAHSFKKRRWDVL